MLKCDFCKQGIEPGTGTTIVDSALGKALKFCSTKCKRNSVDLERNPRKVTWVRKSKKAKVGK